MKLLTEYLSSKINVSDKKKLNDEETQCIVDVIKCAFISILTTKSYKEGSTFQKTIYRGQIDYDLIKENLENEFNYLVYYDDIGKNGIVRKIVKNHIKIIEALINYKTLQIRVKEKSGDEKIVINGRYLFKQYKDKIYKK